MNITLKEVPETLHRKLRERAMANKRSLNSEALYVLEKAVSPEPVNVDEMLANVRRLRGRIHGPKLTEATLREAKSGGRP